MKAVRDNASVDATTISGPSAKALALRDAASAQSLDIPTHGTSMLPNLEPGRLITLGPGVEQCRFGDIGAFVADSGAIVVHRYLFECRGRCWFIGDNNTRFDPRVSPDRVVGRVNAERLLVAHMSNSVSALGRALSRRVIGVFR